MAKWITLEELERLLAMVDVFEPLPPRELRVLAAGTSLSSLGAKETMMAAPKSTLGA